jgi:predicted site-specific integrase-resolvase
MRAARLLSEREAGQLLRVSPRTLQRWRQTGAGPAYLKMGHRVLYHPTVLGDWLQQNLRTKTEQYAREPL